MKTSLLEKATQVERIYIAGCGGMLGEAFHHHFSDRSIRCTDKDVNTGWLGKLDFRDRAAYRADVLQFAPDCLVHLGAHTDLEYCEDNPEDCYLTNTISVETAVEIANELGIPLIYISTAGIFDGKKSFYDDFDLPAPLGHYARSKYAGEIHVRTNCPRHIVARAGWMMGGGPEKDKKFVNKIAKQIASGQTSLSIVDDKLGTPTYTMDFAANVGLLLDENRWGLYNMVCEGETSRLEVAEAILDLLGLSNSIEIHPVPSTHFEKEYFAPRPANERLINRRLNMLGLNRMRHWRTALAEYLNSDFSHLRPT